MQNKTTEKIIIDKLKLLTLQRLGCNERAIIDKVFYDKFTSQDDTLIDTLLESLTDIKSFSNWGGSRENSGRKSNNINNINQDEKIKLIKSSCINQLVDKDKDKDKNKIKNNKYGELGNVLLTEEQYNKLSSEHQNLNLAIEKLDTWLGTSGGKNRNKNHFAYFKSNSWVWENLEKKPDAFELYTKLANNDSKIPAEVYIESGEFFLDNTFKEFSDMTDAECDRCATWLLNNMRCQTLSRDRFVKIVRGFKGAA